MQLIIQFFKLIGYFTRSSLILLLSKFNKVKPTNNFALFNCYSYQNSISIL